MLNSTSRLRVNDRHVTTSVIDGEAIIINLESGLYYSLDQLGAASWELLAAGHSIAESAEALARACNADSAAITADLQRLADELTAHTLVSPMEIAAVSAPTIDLSAIAQLPWVAPTLHVYDDMGDVLALDPPLPQVAVD